MYLPIGLTYRLVIMLLILQIKALEFCNELVNILFILSHFELRHEVLFLHYHRQNNLHVRESLELEDRSLLSNLHMAMAVVFPRVDLELRNNTQRLPTVLGHEDEKAQA